MQQYAAKIMVCLVVGLMSACQPHNAPRPNDAVKAEVKSQVSLIKSQAIQVKLARNDVCREDGCIQYAIQTVKTNLPWIDDYFLQYLEQLEPNAFRIHIDEQVPDLKNEKVRFEQHNQFVHYVGQREHLALFMLQSYSYGGKLDKSNTHHEFINFDLEQKKRLFLKDILNKNQEILLLKLVYEQNLAWLKQRNIELEQLKLSDNFYFSANGLTLVYPVYELGGYYDGMTELTVPYLLLAKVLKTEYLPSLPDYAKAEN